VEKLEHFARALDTSVLVIGGESATFWGAGVGGMLRGGKKWLIRAVSN